MAAIKYIATIVAFLLAYYVLAGYLGITGGFLATILFAVLVVAVLSWFSPLFRISVLKNAKFRLYTIVTCFVGLFLLGGFARYGFTLATLFPATQVTAPTLQLQTCADYVKSINPYLLGKSSTLTLNAWDMASNTPYASAVDAKVSVYKNGDTADKYVATLTDTSAYQLSGFSVGDTISIYEDTPTSYYVDSQVGVCIDSETKSINLNAYSMADVADMETLGYDETGTATLTAGIPGAHDYNMTLGANEQKMIHVKVKVAAADKTFRFGGWAIATFFNISKVEVKGQEGRVYTLSVTPTSFKNRNIKVGTLDTTTINRDYSIYTTSPILLREWESIKDAFIVYADTANDPIDRTNTVFFNGFAIVAVDSACARGDTGVTVCDFYKHDSAQGNVGVAEPLTAPAGKQVGILVATL